MYFCLETVDKGFCIDDICNNYIIIFYRNIEIVNLLPTGHKLGEPSPLFTKIDVAKIEELKQKFAGSQNDRKNNHSTDSNIVADVKIIEEEIAKQVCKKHMNVFYLFINLFI